ncbi:hypothetical protein GCM10016272_02410 [Psychrobacter glaciei]|uniref:HEPN domain-containing protein n=1 Tax=Psychrobacter glaciei TaxID=619771 RepID=A0ABQ3GND3_9GAMM|nr:hypothetical protein [Psychrobacter glaciei]GHD25994.1 hypothetical protein GCM10016272_02410 [Psychrobacter glaciei]
MPVSIDDIYKQKSQIEANSFIPKEAYNRLLISRGYYASFSYACEIVDNKKNGINLIRKDKYKSYGSHECYYESLMQCNYDKLTEVGAKLKRYHHLRKIADYKLKKHVTDADLDRANQYLEECKELMDSFVQSKLNSSLTLNASTIATP